MNLQHKDWMEQRGGEGLREGPAVQGAQPQVARGPSTYVAGNLKVPQEAEKDGTIQVADYSSIWQQGPWSAAELHISITELRCLVA